jgi:tRNA nucleotidyltransferase (CCA-adding enzyme)
MKVILTHEHADFDAIASQLGAHKLYPDAVPVLPRQINRNVRDFLMLYGSTLPFVEAKDLPKKRVELAILVDTQGVVSIKGMGSHTKYLVIDHHAPSSNMPKGWQYIGDILGANTTLLVEKIAESQIQVSPLEATLLLLGIYEDTGSLLYPTTTSRDIRAAAWLLEHGANLEVARSYLLHPLSAEQKALYRTLVERSETYNIKGHHVVVATASVKGYVDEISTVVHRLRTIYEPDALFVLVAQDGNVQLVARSKTDDIDVGVIAAEFGGGGHPRASAALVKQTPLAQVKKKLIETIEKHTTPPASVANIMSNGVKTLYTTDKVEDVADRMLRLGHEGFPVLDPQTQEIVGIITRREIDRAMGHGLGKDPISRYMRPGKVYVHPDDPIHKVRDLMLESGWGQIPVVDRESGKIIGIVTRTDLIKTLGGARPKESLAKLMEERWPPLLLALLRKAGEKAQQMGIQVYVVGGSVRDLILGQENFDVDMVVEGDAIALVKELQRELGGRVKAHRRFGTAKWLLPDRTELRRRLGMEDKDFDIESLDFATARAEYYTHPTALPTVESGSIKLDLLRRDFTINTLAIRLNPSRWGELLDFYGGMRDIEQGTIRVLHSLSFIDDPTRILRAVRFEQRFGFRIEERTEELIGNALDLLHRVSGPRLRNELELILREKEPEKAIRRLGELGVLPYLNEELRYDEWIDRKFKALRQMAEQHTPPGPMERLYFGVLTYRLSHEARQAIAERLRLRRETIRLMNDLESLREKEHDLASPDLRPSDTYEIFHRTCDEARFVFGAITDIEMVRLRWMEYENTLRHVRTEVSGEDLKAMGLRPGPLYKKLLKRLLHARLDGEVHSKEEELDLVRRLLQAQ